MTRSELFTDAADAADELLRDVYRLDVAKVLDPLDRHDFLVIVQRLGRALAGVSREAEADALRRALATLDVDWPKLTPAARDQVLRAAREAVHSAAAQVLPRVDQLFEVEGKRVIADSRRSAVRQFGLRIAASTTSTDDRIAAFVRRSESHFIRDQYGRRADELGQRARDIVASGLERGLGRDDIVGDLSVALTPATGRAESLLGGRRDELRQPGPDVHAARGVRGGRHRAISASNRFSIRVHQRGLSIHARA